MGISCEPGFKFHKNHNLLAEFRLQCISKNSNNNNNNWLGFVPNCIPRKCSFPKIPKNGKIRFQLKNNTNIEISFENSSIFNELLKKQNEIENLFSPGQRITLNCEKNYKIIGNNSRICTFNETWTNNESFCQLKKCPIELHLIWNFFAKFPTNIIPLNWQKKREIFFTNIIENLSIFFEGNFYNDKIIFSCQNKTAFSGENLGIFQIQWKCNENGDWIFENWEIIDENEIIDLFLKNGGKICETVKCKRPKVNFSKFFF